MLIAILTVAICGLNRIPREPIAIKGPISIKEIIDPVSIEEPVKVQGWSMRDPGREPIPVTVQIEPNY